MIGRIRRSIAVKCAQKNRKEFVVNIDNIWDNLRSISQNVDVQVVSFSGSKYFYDQLFSIYSFYFNVGIPKKWKVYTDGTYNVDEISFLKSIPNIEVCFLDLDQYSENWKIYFDRYPTLKKIAILKELDEFSIPIIFADSDILFFSMFRNEIEKCRIGNWYLQDESSNYFDKEYLDTNKNINYPLNLGFMIFNEPVNWDIVTSYIEGRIESNTLSYWTDQTAMQIMVSSSTSNFSPLDKNKFVLNGSDSFKINSDFNYEIIALRHFVGPIRHKMWQFPWKVLLERNTIY